MRTWQVQFGGKPQPPLLSWLLLAIGVACLAASGRTYILAHEAQALADSLNKLRLVQTQEATAQQAQANGPVTLTYLQDKRWQRASAELDAPWMATLSALEKATKQPIFLTGIKVEPHDGRIQIDAEGASLESVLAYVQTLQNSQALGQVRLLRHEEAADATGRMTLRFAIQTGWVTTK